MNITTTADYYDKTIRFYGVIKPDTMEQKASTNTRVRRTHTPSASCILFGNISWNGECGFNDFIHLFSPAASLTRIKKWHEKNHFPILAGLPRPVSMICTLWANIFVLSTKKNNCSPFKSFYFPYFPCRFSHFFYPCFHFFSFKSTSTFRHIFVHIWGRPNNDR